MHHPLKTDRRFTARMKAIRIFEYGGTGTLKLESQTTRCWFEFTMPVYQEGDLKQLRRQRCDKHVRK